MWKNIPVVTVDITSLKELAKHKSEEMAEEIKKRCFQIFTLEVENYRGRVIGSGKESWVAVFGLAAGNSNSAELAIRAGLAIKAGIRKYSDKLTDQGRGEIQGKIGIDSQKASLELLNKSTAEQLQPQDFESLTFISQKLVQISDHGAILISENIYRQVMGIFDIETLPPFWLDQNTKVTAFQVMGEKAFNFHVEYQGSFSGQSDFVNREEEFQILKSLHEKVKAEKTPHLVTISGKKGIGKSRLMAEFYNYLEISPDIEILFAGRAVEDESKVPFSLLKNMAVNRFQLDLDDPRKSMDLLLQGMARFCDPNLSLEENIAATEKNLKGKLSLKMVEMARYLAFLSGLDSTGETVSSENQSADNRIVLQNAFESLKEFFNHCGRNYPIIVICEDAHWADRPSLELLEYLLNNIEDRAILMVLVARDEFYYKYPGWGKSTKLHYRVDLKPLSAEYSKQVQQNCFNSCTGVPSRFAEDVIKESKGNPAYIYEYIRMLANSNVITMDNNRNYCIFPSPATLDKFEKPSSYSDLFQMQLDTLSKSEELVLEVASVMGQVFWLGFVEYVFSQELDGNFCLPRAVIQQVLDNLEVKQFINLKSKSSLKGQMEYSFRDDLLQPMVYAKIEKNRISQYHLLAAQWLNEQSKYAERCPWLLAEHYFLAGNYARALNYYINGGEVAKKYCANQETIYFLSKAVSIIERARGPEYCLEMMKIAAQEDIRVANWQRRIDIYLDLASAHQEDCSFDKAIWMLDKAALQFPGKELRQEGSFGDFEILKYKDKIARKRELISRKISSPT